MKKTGRPLSFDREAAVENAMLVFWREGYEGTSLTTLISEMGIASQSLYNAFGGKEQLFIEALQRYVTRSDDSTNLTFTKAATAKIAIRQHLEAAATNLVAPGHPSGCMLTLAASYCATAPAQAQATLAKYRVEHETRIKHRLDRGIEEGDLPPETDTAVTASFFMTVLQGMSTQARYGATKKKLLAIARSAMCAWPEGDQS